MLDLAKVGQVETARLAVADFDEERAGGAAVVVVAWDCMKVFLDCILFSTFA